MKSILALTFLKKRFLDLILHIGVLQLCLKISYTGFLTHIECLDTNKEDLGEVEIRFLFFEPLPRNRNKKEEKKISNGTGCVQKYPKLGEKITVGFCRFPVFNFFQREKIIQEDRIQADIRYNYLSQNFQQK